FMTAVRSHQLYPPESKAIPQALEQLCDALEELFTKNAWLHLSQDRQVLLANGQRLELTEWSALAGSVLDLLDRFELPGLIVPRILRALQTAAKKVKLYPPEAEVVTQAVEQLHASLQDAVRRRQSLTLAGVQHALLANGVRVDTSGYETIASAVIDLLGDAGL